MSEYVELSKQLFLMTVILCMGFLMTFFTGVLAYAVVRKPSIFQEFLKQSYRQCPQCGALRREETENL